MPDPSNPIASLYPQPPQQQNNSLLANPLSALSAIQGVQNLGIQRQQFQATQAAGQAFQNALNPDGTINPSKLATGLRNPTAALAAPQAISQGLQQQGNVLDNQSRQIGVAQNNLALRNSQNTTFWQALQAASQGDVSDAGLAETKARIARMFPQTQVPSDELNRVFSQAAATPDQNQRRQILARIGANALTVPQAVTPLSTTDPSGNPAVIPTGALAANPGGVSTGFGNIATQSRQDYVAAQNNAAGLRAGIRPLQQALPLIEQLSNTDFGPGSAQYAKLKGLLTTAGLVPPGATSLDLRQAASKYLSQSVQASMGAGRSDEGLRAALGANPNLDLTQKANIGLVKNQIAMSRMDAAMSQAYDAEHPEDTSKVGFNTYKSNYYQNQDPRAFRFDLMTPQERRDTLDSLGQKGSQPYNNFIRSLTIARHAGDVTVGDQ